MKKICSKSTLRLNQQFLIVNATKKYQFKARDSEIKDYTLCLGNISKDFAINNMGKNRMKRKCKVFSVGFKPIDINNILDTHRY